MESQPYSTVMLSIMLMLPFLIEFLVCMCAGNLSILPMSPSPSADRWLMKMHGCVRVPDSIVLTRRDYIRYAETSAALGGAARCQYDVQSSCMMSLSLLAGILQALLMTKHVLFIGFSMTDDNFHRFRPEPCLWLVTVMNPVQTRVYVYRRLFDAVQRSKSVRSSGGSPEMPYESTRCDSTVFSCRSNHCTVTCAELHWMVQRRWERSCSWSRTCFRKNCGESIWTLYLCIQM